MCIELQDSVGAFLTEWPVGLERGLTKGQAGTTTMVPNVTNAKRTDAAEISRVVAALEEAWQAQLEQSSLIHELTQVTVGEEQIQTAMGLVNSLRLDRQLI